MLDYDLLDDQDDGLRERLATLSALKRSIQDREQFRQGNYCQAEDAILNLSDDLILHALIAEKLFGWSFSASPIEISALSPTHWGFLTHWRNETGTAQMLPDFKQEVHLLLEKAEMLGATFTFERTDVGYRLQSHDIVIASKYFYQVIGKLLLIRNLREGK
jgi:hypothetical protein